MRRSSILALALCALATTTLAAGFPDYLIIRDHLGAWPRDNGGGRVVTQSLLARLVDESGATLYEELHCDVAAVGHDDEVELALGTVDPAANPLDLRFDGRWSVQVIACDDGACVDGIPLDASRCDGDTLLDKPLDVYAYAWRSRYAEHADTADHALTADDCDSLDGLDSSDFMPAGADEWVNETGDTMTGPLILSNDPTEDAMAATKKYVDEQIRAAIPRGYAILGPSLVSPPGFLPSGRYISTDGEWETLAPLPTPSAPTATVLDGLIYARTEPNVLQVYDPATNAWTQATGPGSGQAVVARGGALHLMGLDLVVGEHWERPPGSTTWQRRASVPGLRVSDVGVSGGVLYALSEAVGGALWMWSWDPTSDSWTRRASPLCDCDARALVDFNGSMWALGGWELGSDRTQDQVEIYDPATGFWTEGPRMKRERAHASAAVVDGRLYVLGGEGHDDSFGGGGWFGGDGDEGDSIEMFDPAVGEWQVLPSRVPTIRWLRAAVALGGRIHVVGGGAEYLRRVDLATMAHEAFTPQERWYVHVKQ